MDFSDVLILAAIFVCGIMAGIGGCMAFGLKGFQNPFSRKKETAESDVLTTALAASFTRKHQFPNLTELLQKPIGSIRFTAGELRDHSHEEREVFEGSFVRLCAKLDYNYLTEYDPAHGELRLRWREKKESTPFVIDVYNDVKAPTPQKFRPEMLDKPEGSYTFSREELREMRFEDMSELQGYLMTIAERKNIQFNFVEQFGVVDGVELRWRQEK